ncbi:MAG: hypothetical protein ACK56F_28645 [bacterium]
MHIFEIPQECGSWHLLSGINPVLHMIFSFMQMYFLFMHARYRWYQLHLGTRFLFVLALSKRQNRKMENS